MLLMIGNIFLFCYKKMLHDAYRPRVHAMISANNNVAENEQTDQEEIAL